MGRPTKQRSTLNSVHDTRAGAQRSTLSDRAREAAELQQSAALKAQKDAFGKLLLSRFGIKLPTPLIPSLEGKKGEGSLGLTVTIEGVTLRYDPLGHNAVRLVRVCDKCGTAVESHELSELAHLGAALASPLERHLCKEKTE
ncbi:MAG: hypothetical protein ABSA97_07360 [Verrucomicrobiia bacterium]